MLSSSNGGSAERCEANARLADVVKRGAVANSIVFWRNKAAPASRIRCLSSQAPAPGTVPLNDTLFRYLRSGPTVSSRIRLQEAHVDRIIAIGGSAGGIAAIKTLCGALTPDIPAAICIVIHVGARGHNIIADIFQQRCPIPMETAVDGQKLQHGRAYVARADHHLIVEEGVIRLGRGPRENLARPAIDPLLRSAGLSYGSRAIGVVLTGMLNDGAAGLADLKRCGGVTIVQNPIEATEREMPLAALSASDVDYQTPIAELGALLNWLVVEPCGPSPPSPEDVRLEVEIALGHPTGTDEMNRLANPVALSCPACGGVMSQMRSAPPLRFRCQVGHAYTADSLSAEQEGSVDEAMRVALRIAEERAVLTQKMAEEARRGGLRHSAASYDRTSAQSRRHVETLRHALRSELWEPKGASPPDEEAEDQTLAPLSRAAP
jgi:two-component system, chemotaxis family, protein-glutamate methylesterase/glutaminase